MGDPKRCNVRNGTECELGGFLPRPYRLQVPLNPKNLKPINFRVLGTDTKLSCQCYGPCLGTPSIRGHATPGSQTGPRV